MKATLPWLGAALVAVLAAPAAHAQYFGRPCAPQAPDAYGPGFYAPNMYGQWYGPNYSLYPGFAPYNGERPPVSGAGGAGGFGGAGGAGGFGGAGGAPGFPTHPYARSPRDFFMVGVENPYAATAVYPSPDFYGAPRPAVPAPAFPAPLTPPTEGGRR